MNVNDLASALRGHETVTFEIRNLGSTTYETKEFEEAVNQIDQFRIRETAKEPPTEKDEALLAYHKNYCVWYIASQFDVRHFPEVFTHWTHCLEMPNYKENPKEQFQEQECLFESHADDCDTGKE